MTLSELQASILEQLGYGQTPGTDITTRLVREINLAHRKVLGMRGMSKLRQSILTFTSVTSSPFATLPQAVASIRAVVDRTNRRVLEEIQLQEIRWRDPGLVFTSSIPEAYTILNYTNPVAANPATPLSLWATSDDASDTTGISVAVEGVITGGYYTRRVTSMNGTTPVQIGTDISTWEQITKCYLSSFPKGHVTITSGSGGGATLAVIQPGRTRGRYTQIQLFGTPGQPITYYCDVEERIENLVSPTDEPLIPEDYQHVLESIVLMREFRRRKEFDQFKVELGTSKEILKDLRDFLSRKSGPSTGGARGGGRRWSQLGPWFTENT